MKAPVEIELKFAVPAGSRQLVDEMSRAQAAPQRITLGAQYLDTADRRLAKAGLAWRLRREGRRWVQCLKAAGPSAIERFEHEVPRPNASPDAQAHAGTPAGDRLIRLLQDAKAEGQEVEVRYRTDVRRLVRRVRTRGAVVEVAFDEGRLSAVESALRIREVEFELVSGSAVSMLAMAERWRKRFGLVLDPRSKAERGDRLAQGSPFPALRKASHPRYADDANALEAFARVVDECLAHITANAIGLCDGDPALRVEHVHQLRVGIRRLRSALRCFRGWVPEPRDALVDELRALFTTLGAARDRDVLDSGVAAALARAGAPDIPLAASAAAAPDPVAVVRGDDAQRLLLAWTTWRVSWAEAASTPPPKPAAPAAPHDAPAPTAAADAGVATAGAVVPDSPAAATAAALGGDVAAPTPEPDPAGAFHRKAERRLRRWHRRIAGDANRFDALDEAALHALRKRIKRQRYAVEFFAPVLRRKAVKRYLEPLTAMQERMGELNDLFVARGRYQDVVTSDPAAWFALGWITARIAEVRRQAKRDLDELATARPPGT